MALIKDHKILSTCDELYHEVFDEIIKDFPDYTKEQFELLIDLLKVALEATETLYKRYREIPRLACVLLLKRVHYIESLLFLKEATEKDISKFTLRVDSIISVSQSIKRFKQNYRQLLHRCRKQTTFHLFYDYHIDNNQYALPSVDECRKMFENPSRVHDWLATDVTASTDSDRAPLLKSN